MSTKIRNRVKLMFDQVDDKGNPLPSVRSRTKQAFAEQVNINTIMKKVARTGLAPQKSGAFYGDFSNGDDYQTCLTKINQANDAFALIPADIRKKFDNDPASLLSFLADPANREEAYKLGLLTAPEHVDIPRPAQQQPAGSPAGSTPPASTTNTAAPV